MIFYEPVPLELHDELLGKNFNEIFTQEMSEFYAPFLKPNRKLTLSKECWEYAVADAIPNGEWAGAGKSVIDVVAGDISIDVKGLSCNNYTGETTEASILQNHQSKHDNTYMVFFEQSNFEGLYDIYVQSLLDKMKDIDNMYLFCATRQKKSLEVFYSLLKVVPSQLTKREFIACMHRHKDRSVNVPLINPKYGRTYIYMPKRRLEIRLQMSGINPEFMKYSHTLPKNY